MYECRQGGKTGAVQKCTTCRGRGMRIMIRQLAPGMVQQMQSVCTDCNGEGKIHSGRTTVFQVYMGTEKPKVT